MAQKRLTTCLALGATALLAGCSHPDAQKTGIMSSPSGTSVQPHLTGAHLAEQIQAIQNNPSIPPDEKAQIISHMQQAATAAP